MPNVKNNRVVLVVEDEMPLQNAIRLKLEKNNFSVVTARNVEQAKNHLQDIEKVDIIWLDHYLLGQETGLDFVSWVKNDKKYKNIPVFVISNTASSDKVKTYLALGVKKYYTKSDLRLENIIREINDCLDNKKLS